ncbi:MAG: hypothetical protein ABI874_03925, partial [Chloroflexota bacterium]
VLAQRPRAQWPLALTARVLPAALIVLVWGVWSQFNGDQNWANAVVTETGTWQLLRTDALGTFARRVSIATLTLNVYMLPLWVSLAVSTPVRLRALRSIGRWRLIGAAVVVALFWRVVLGMAARGEQFPYLTDILTAQGFRPYLGYLAYESGANRAALAPSWFWLALTVLGAVCASSAIVAVCARLSPPCGDTSRARPLSRARIFIYLSLLALTVPSLLFATFYERYLLPLLPLAIIVWLDLSPQGGLTRGVRVSARASRAAQVPSPDVAGLGCGLSALCVFVVWLASVLLMRDYWGWNEALWQTGRSLLQQGVPARQIDGGLEWDGWHLYDDSLAHVRATGKPMIIHPWLYILDPRFMFAFDATPGYRIADTLRFATPLRSRGVDQIYLLERE